MKNQSRREKNLVIYLWNDCGSGGQRSWRNQARWKDVTAEDSKSFV